MLGTYLDTSRYRKVDQEERLESEQTLSLRPEGRSRLTYLGYCSLASLCLLGSGWITSRLLDTATPDLTVPEASLPRCDSPRVRREWRGLDSLEKSDYIHAVRCLLSHPSRLRPSGVLYDDYPYAHARHAQHSHNAAPFLPWHRYFLHSYETDLQDLCGYAGNLPYWDWTLDWDSLASSPVFSNVTGFGGNGNIEAGGSVDDGYCVTDGPFSDLILPFYGSDDHDHCLSRAFVDGHTQGRLPGDQVEPSAVEEILRQPDYKSFFIKLEKGPHNQIPNGIGGDFLKFTAPNDPLFFLHHSQLDRLWWLWQRTDAGTRQFDYGEITDDVADGLGTLHDIIDIGGLLPAIQTNEIMDTEAGFLCYGY